MVLRLLIGIGIVGLIINNILPNTPTVVGGKEKYLNRIIYMGLSVASLNIIYILVLITSFNNSEYQYRDALFSLGLDGINLSLVLLVAFIEPILLLIFVGRTTTKEIQSERMIINYLIIIKILLNILFLTFDILVFFITFELILIPLFLIITYYGSTYPYYLPRIEAGIRFFIYTILGSILMLVGIIVFYILYGSSNFQYINYMIFTPGSSPCGEVNHIEILTYIWFFIFFSFIIKLPIFPFHTWLPLAHSDAPTIGSVILAGILLKLGSYGILRYSLNLYSPLTFLESKELLYSSYIPYIFILAIISIIFSSLIPLRSLFDMKKMIAYSSIVHMNFSIFGLFSNNIIGLLGGSLLMFTHAWISSALFLLIGFLYNQFHTRNILYYRGLSQYLPIFSFFFLFFTFGNISLPFCSSFIAELLILISTINLNPIITTILLISLIISSSFGIWFGNRILFGIPYKSTQYPYDLNLTDILSLIPFFFCTIFFTFVPEPILALLLIPLTSLI